MGYTSKVHMWDGKSKETACERAKSTVKEVTREWDKVTCRRCRRRSPNGSAIYRLKNDLVFIDVREISSTMYLVQRYDNGELNDIETRVTRESAKALADRWFNNGDIPYIGRIYEARNKEEHGEDLVVNIKASIVIPKNRSEEFYEKIGNAQHHFEGKIRETNEAG